MADAGRSFWKGYLRLSLVNIPVRLVSATRSDGEVAFHQVDRVSKQRIRYQKVVPGKGEVKPENIARGFEVSEGQYVLLDDAELDAIKLKTLQTIELINFVDACHIDPLYFDKGYLVLPDGDVAEEGYRVIRDALRERGVVGIGQLTMRGKENLVALKASGKGMSLETLHYQSEVKDIDAVFSSIGETKLKPDLLDMAKDLITRKTTEFDQSKYTNHYADALRELVAEKMKSGKIIDVGGDKPGETSTVIDFMEALKKTVAAAGSSKAAAADVAKPDKAKPKVTAAAKPAKKAG